MAANQPTPQPGASDSNDKLLAAASYPVALIISLIILLTDMKARPFLKYHAVQSLVANVVIGIVFVILSTILTVITFGIGGLCVPILWLVWLGVMIYWAYLAYQGQYVVIPFITNFCKQQGWI